MSESDSDVESDIELYIESKFNDVRKKYPDSVSDSDIESHIESKFNESYIESKFNDAREKYPDSVLDIDLRFCDVREKYLERTSKFRLLDKLLSYLAEMATLMHRGNTVFRFRNGATVEWMYPKGDKVFRILNATEWRYSYIVMSDEIVTLRNKVVIVLDHFTKIMESEKLKLKRGDITTLTRLGESLRDIVDLIIFEKDVFIIVGRAIEIIKSIFQSRDTFKLLWNIKKVD